MIHPLHSPLLTLAFVLSLALRVSCAGNTHASSSQSPDLHIIAPSQHSVPDIRVTTPYTNQQSTFGNHVKTNPSNTETIPNEQESLYGPPIIGGTIPGYIHEKIIDTGVLRGTRMDQEQVEHTDEGMDSLSEMKPRRYYLRGTRRRSARNPNSLVEGKSPMLPGHPGYNPKARASFLREHVGESIATAQHSQSGGNTKQNEVTITDEFTTPLPRSGCHNGESDAIFLLSASDLRSGRYPNSPKIPLSDDIFAPQAANIITVPYSTVTSANFETRRQFEGESRLEPKRQKSKDLFRCKSLSGLRSIATSHGKGTNTDFAESITSRTAASTTTLPATKPNKWFTRFLSPRAKT